MSSLNKKIGGARYATLFAQQSKARAEVKKVRGTLLDIMKEERSRGARNQVSLSGREEEQYWERQRIAEAFEREQLNAFETKLARRMEERSVEMDRVKVIEKMSNVFHLELNRKMANEVARELSKLLPPHLFMQLSTEQLKEILAKSEKLKSVIMKLKDNKRIQRFEMQEAAQEVGQIVQQME
jgi:D-tyrosyl-tRNA(Tyr) deacylase